MTAVQHLKRALVGITLLGLAAHASAQVLVTDAWVRASVPGQPSSGAFMTVTADSDSTLLSVASPVAKDVQIHEMSMKDDVMRMGPVDSVALPAGKAVTLDPDYNASNRTPRHFRRTSAITATTGAARPG